jgi:chromosome segregation ATPase
VGLENELEYLQRVESALATLITEMGHVTKTLDRQDREIGELFRRVNQMSQDQALLQQSKTSLKKEVNDLPELRRDVQKLIEKDRRNDARMDSAISQVWAAFIVAIVMSLSGLVISFLKMKT